MQAVYIMHPYWDESPMARAYNVEMAGKLAARVLQIGCKGLRWKNELRSW